MSVACPYCQRPAQLLRWQEAGYPYPADWGPAWKCEPCDAFIRCYQGTTRPLGTLADAPTRHWRHLAHRALDPLWQGGGQSRSAVYRWLAGGDNEVSVDELTEAYEFLITHSIYDIINEDV